MKLIDFEKDVYSGIVSKIWHKFPNEGLKEFDNGTLFLLKSKNGTIHVCCLHGNSVEDKDWMAIRLSDFEVIHLKNQKDSTYAFVGFVNRATKLNPFFNKIKQGRNFKQCRNFVTYNKRKKEMS